MARTNAIKRVLCILLALIIVLLFILFLQSYNKYKIQMKRYSQAKELSLATNKKLLVIGDPLESSTNYLFGNYGFGDICIDMNLDLNSKNTNGSVLIKDRLENVLHQFKDNSVVIFESEVLEYVDSIEYVIREMNRISCGDIFSVHQLKPNSIFTYCKSRGYSFFNKLSKKPLYSHKRLFKRYPPYHDYEYIKI